MRPARQILWGAVLGVCGCGEPEILAAGPDRVLDPGAPGPYAVGVTTVTVVDESRASLVPGEAAWTFAVEIWYPAAGRASTPASDTIDPMAELPEDLQAELGDLGLPTLTQPARRDAPPRTNQGEFPVVVFSHGYGSKRYQSFALTTHLASHGYVVVAPDHPASRLFDSTRQGSVVSALIQEGVDRPRDIRLVLDRLAQGDLGGGELDALADLEHVAMTGHSFGGFTALLISSPAAQAYDDRVDAIVSITPGTNLLVLFGAETAKLEAPTLYVGATLDQTVDYGEVTVPAYEQQVSAKALAGVVGAGHFSFSEVCDLHLSPVAPRLRLDQLAAVMEVDTETMLNDGCTAEYIDLARAKALANSYVTGWLNAYLRGSTRTLSRYLSVADAPADVELRRASAVD